MTFLRENPERMGIIYFLVSGHFNSCQLYSEGWMLSLSTHSCILCSFRGGAEPLFRVT